jgi:hypothetical protein
MKIEVGSTVLITTNNWFYGPDGREYRGVFGTVKAVRSDDETLGIKTNRNATNWYVEVGSMVIAGCQIFYVVACDVPPPERATAWSVDAGSYKEYDRPTVIFNADAQP